MVEAISVWRRADYSIRTSAQICRGWNSIIICFNYRDKKKNCLSGLKLFSCPFFEVVVLCGCHCIYVFTKMNSRTNCDIIKIPRVVRLMETHTPLRFWRMRSLVWMRDRQNSRAACFIFIVTHVEPLILLFAHVKYSANLWTTRPLCSDTKRILRTKARDSNYRGARQIDVAKCNMHRYFV